MYSTGYQPPLLTIFSSGGANPFRQWDRHIKYGHISTFLDTELKTLVTDVCGLNVSTTYITCPKGNQNLGIVHPYMVMIVKNLKKYFAFEVTILDNSRFKRRFRFANFRSDTKITFTSTVMPICLADGWNQIQFNLSDFTRKAYNKEFAEVVSLKINANIRLKRIYFTQKLVTEDELPIEYRLFYPLQRRSMQRKLSDPICNEVDENRPCNENIPLQCPNKFIERNDIDEAEDKEPQNERHVSVGFVPREPSKTSDHVQSVHSQESIGMQENAAKTSQELLRILSHESIKLSQETAKRSQESIKGSQESRRRSQESTNRSQIIANTQGSIRTSQGSIKSQSNTKVGSKGSQPSPGGDKKASKEELLRILSHESKQLSQETAKRSQESIKGSQELRRRSQESTNRSQITHTQGSIRTSQGSIKSQSNTRVGSKGSQPSAGGDKNASKEG